jgi:hypothetical protein
MKKKMTEEQIRIRRENEDWPKRTDDTYAALGLPDPSLELPSDVITD